MVKTEPPRVFHYEHDGHHYIAVSYDVTKAPVLYLEVESKHEWKKYVELVNLDPEVICGERPCTGIFGIDYGPNPYED